MKNFELGAFLDSRLRGTDTSIHQLGSAESILNTIQALSFGSTVTYYGVKPALLKEVVSELRKSRLPHYKVEVCIINGSEFIQVQANNPKLTFNKRLPALYSLLYGIGPESEVYAVRFTRTYFWNV